LQVEPAIIGGIIIDVGDKHIDLSILTRVKKIQQLLLETV
jgi:F-type H+-transporting ATPase subunit O